MFARFALFAAVVALSAPISAGFILGSCHRADAACGRCWNGQAGSDYTDRYGKYRCMPC